MAVLEEPIKEIVKVRSHIDGEWVDSRGQLIDVVNPATGKTIARMPISTKEELEKAAQAAFPDWRATTPLVRSRCLFRMKELLEENFEELSRIQTMEHSKTIDESRGETRRGIENVEVAFILVNGRNCIFVDGMDAKIVKGKEFPLETSSRRRFFLLPLFIRLAEEFTRGVKEGMKVSPSFYDGIRHQEIIDAILLSQRERRWVTLAPERTRHL